MLFDFSMHPLGFAFADSRIVWVRAKAWPHETSEPKPGL